MHQPSESQRWLVCPKPRPDATMRLLSLPYAGAGVTPFRAWADALPPSIELTICQLPGRESRFREPPLTRLTDVVDTLADLLRPHLDRPWAFFGHSMGSLLAFELARRLEATGMQAPAHLFVSGHRAPHLSAPDGPLHRLPDAEFIAGMRARYNGIPDAILAEPEMLQIYLPLLRADLAVVETYTYVESKPLRCPISFYGGLEDKRANREEAAAWARHTRAGFNMRLFPGGHFYFQGERLAVLRALAAELECVAAPAGAGRADGVL